MKLNFKELDHKIAINEHIVRLPGPLWDVLEYQNRVLVTLRPEFGRRNVFCFNEHGEQLWIIEQDDFFKVENRGYDTCSPGEFQDEGRLLVFGRGRPFYLDIETGKVETIPGIFEK